MQIRFDGKKITTALALVALLAIGAVWGARRARAFNPQPDPPGFGMIGITQGQSVRVSVVNTTPPDPNTPPDPCHVVITFRDASGGLFPGGDGKGLGRVVQLNAGESASLDLNADDFRRAADSAGRLQLQPIARVQQADNNGDGAHPPDPCIPSVEVFNNSTGRTQFSAPFVPAIQRPTTTTTVGGQ